MSTAQRSGLLADVTLRIGDRDLSEGSGGIFEHVLVASRAGGPTSALMLRRPA
jgi:hypothetical protein